MEEVFLQEREAMLTSNKVRTFSLLVIFVHE